MLNTLKTLEGLKGMKALQGIKGVEGLQIVKGLEGLKVVRKITTAKSYSINQIVGKLDQDNFNFLSTCEYLSKR